MKAKYFFLPVVFAISYSIVFAQDKSAGWQTLFDGKSLQGWNRVAGTADYKVENGAIVGSTVLNSPNSFLVSEKKFSGDFVLELDALIEDSAMNSGVQFRSNYDPAANGGKGKLFGCQFELDPSSRK